MAAEPNLQVNSTRRRCRLQNCRFIPNTVLVRRVLGLVYLRASRILETCELKNSYLQTVRRHIRPYHVYLRRLSGEEIKLRCTLDYTGSTHYLSHRQLYAAARVELELPKHISLIMLDPYNIEVPCRDGSCYALAGKVLSVITHQ